MALRGGAGAAVAHGAVGAVAAGAAVVDAAVVGAVAADAAVAGAGVVVGAEAVAAAVAGGEEAAGGAETPSMQKREIRELSGQCRLCGRPSSNPNKTHSEVKKPQNPRVKYSEVKEKKGGGQGKEKKKEILRGRKEPSVTQK